MITSISRQLAQQIVDTIHDVCGYHINFMNKQGKIYASSNPERLDTYHEIARQVVITGKTIEVEKDNSYTGTNKGINIPIYHHKNVIAVVGISGEPENVRRYAHLAERISGMLLHEQELNEKHRTDDEKRLYIIQSLQNGNYDNPDYLKECLTEYHIDSSFSYRMILFEINTRYNLVNISLLEQHIETLFSSLKYSVYSYMYPNRFVGIVRSDIYDSEFYKLNLFTKNHEKLVNIAIGKEISFNKLHLSWQSAETALHSLKGTTNSIAIFDDLTLEILFSNVRNITLEEYSNKVLSKLSEKDLNLLKIYFRENLSLQQTAEILFLHKNTVQQRLNRISNTCGFNPRKFDEAVCLYLGIIASDKLE